MSAFLDTIRKHPPNPSHPLVSIVIPVRNPDEEIFRACLLSLLPHPLLPYCEILIIDSSTREVQAYREFQEILHIFPLTRKNLSGARQDALDHVRGDVIVSIDCDCITEDGWLEAILTPLNRDKNVVATVGYNLPAKEEWIPQWFQDAYETWIPYVSAEIGNKRYMFTIDMKNYAVYTDVAKEVGYDEEMRAAEDHDFATRLRRKGYFILFAPNARVRHFHRETLTTLLKQQEWHGLGYGQTTIKNDFDIYSQRPFRWLIRQGLTLALFPLFLIQLIRIWKWEGLNGVRTHLVSTLVGYRFQLGMIRGIHVQGGGKSVKKRFLSDIFSHYPDATIKFL